MHLSPMHDRDRQPSSLSVSLEMMWSFPGWYDYRPAMVDLLQEEGLPTADEIDQGFPAALFILAGVSLVVALAFAATAWRRRRLQVTVDTTG